MCGIVAYTGKKPAASILLQALRDLEYRGYDSAGIAVLTGSGAETRELVITKREGKIANLEAAVAAAECIEGTTGIGHTRWATHGKPSDINAHPHTSCGSEVVVIHNGIVENYVELRDQLLRRGHAFLSETDTETIAHLMEERLKAGDDLLAALSSVARMLDGSQAIVAMSEREPGVIVAARIGNAGGVVIGYGQGEMLIASDLAAILPHTRRVAYLADGQLARIEADSVRYLAQDGTSIDLSVHTVPIDPMTALKGQYPHFMLKEIMEQPLALSDTIRSLVTFEPIELHLNDLAAAAERLAEVNRVVLIGMGTSLHAAMVGRRYFEALARVPAETDNASEFRYRDPILGPDTLVVSVSQSGETVDVLEAMAVAKRAGALLITICNVEGAQTTRVADGTVYTRAGLERGVASTKTYVSAMVAMYALALQLGISRGTLTPDGLKHPLENLAHVPDAVARSLTAAGQYRALAERFVNAEDFLFIGRGLAFPTAMEGALKMKEISYIHAEGYAAGEMKHGPIALIDDSFPTVAIATKHALRAKTVSNLQQVQARGGEVIAIVTEGDAEVARMADFAIQLPDVPELLEPVVAAIPAQLLSYELAVARGCDVDQPRNLAKTVTVE